MKLKWETVGTALEIGAFFCLLAAVIITPLGLGGALPWSLFVMRTALAVGGALWLCGAALRGRMHLPRLPAVVALLAYVGLVWLSGILSGLTYPTVQIVINLSLYAAAFFVAAGTMTTRARQRVFLVSFLILSWAMGIYGLLQFLGFWWKLVPHLNADRYSSFYYNVNHFCGFLAMAIPLTAALCLWSKGFWLRLHYVLLTALLLFNIGLDYSHALLAVGITLTALLLRWLAGLKRPIWKIAGAAILILALTGIALGAPLRYADRVKAEDKGLWGKTKAFYRYLVLEKSQDRYVLFGNSVKVIREEPILGAGPGNYIYKITEYRPPKIDDWTSSMMHNFVNYSHNDYTQVAAETGLLGLLAYLAFWLTALIFRPRAAGEPWRIGVIASLAAILLYGIAEGNLTIMPANILIAFTLAGFLQSPPPNP